MDSDPRCLRPRMDVAAVRARGHVARDLRRAARRNGVPMLVVGEDVRRVVVANFEGPPP